MDYLSLHLTRPPTRRHAHKSSQNTIYPNHKHTGVHDDNLPSARCTASHSTQRAEAAKKIKIGDYGSWHMCPSMSGPDLANVSSWEGWMCVCVCVCSQKRGEGRIKRKWLCLYRAWLSLRHYFSYQIGSWIMGWVEYVQYSTVQYILYYNNIGFTILSLIKFWLLNLNVLHVLSNSNKNGKLMDKNLTLFLVKDIFSYFFSKCTYSYKYIAMSQLLKLCRVMF